MIRIDRLRRNRERISARLGAGIAMLAAFGLSAASASPPRGRSCAGVSFPGTIIVDGTKLQLNGLGLREATFLDVDVFVAALYVQHRSSDAKTLLARDAPVRVVLHFVRDTSAETIAEEMDKGYLANTPEIAAAKKKQLFAWLEDMAAGRALAFTYVPARGLEVSVGGRLKGTITGPEFASATLAVLIGQSVVDEDLRAGMLGGRCE